MKKIVNSLAVWILAGSCLLGGYARLAWWSTVYPQSLYESGAAETDFEEEDADKIQIKWKLAEWIRAWF